MDAITKVSEITSESLGEYLRLPEITEDDTNTLNNLLGIAKTYMSNYSGRSMEELDNYQDFVIVCFVLVQDMWDNRTLYVDSSNINHVVESILGMHSVNLLPQETDDD